MFFEKKSHLSQNDNFYRKKQFFVINLKQCVNRHLKTCRKNWSKFTSDITIFGFLTAVTRLIYVVYKTATTLLCSTQKLCVMCKSRKKNGGTPTVIWFFRFEVFSRRKTLCLNKMNNLYDYLHQLQTFSSLIFSQKTVGHVLVGLHGLLWNFCDNQCNVNA